MTTPNTSRKEWVILRCSNCKTLELARSLTDAGFEAWSPSVHLQKRKGEASKRPVVVLPLLASYVFAPYQHLAELLALSHSPALNYRVWDSELRRMVVKGHPYFRVFKDGGQFPRVPERQLNALREAEQRTLPKPAIQALPINLEFTMSAAGFEGLSATVVKSSKSYTELAVETVPYPVKLPTWMLAGVIDEGVSSVVSADTQALHAKAA